MALRYLLALCMVTGFLAHASEAQAECMASPAHMLANGTVLPPNPRLVFFKGDANFEVLADGKAVPFEVLPIEDAAQRPRAFWLSIEAAEASVLTVRHTHSYQPSEFVFRIDKAWSRQPAKLLGSERNRPLDERVMCPAPSDTYRLNIASRAVAYRVQWDGPTPGQQIVPTHHMLRWAKQPKFPEATDTNPHPDLVHSVDLGVESCIGNSIPYQLLDSGATVELTALYPDGSEESVGHLILNDGPASIVDLHKKGAAQPDAVGALVSAEQGGERSSAMTCSTIFLLGFLGTLGLLSLLGALLRPRPQLAMGVGLGLLGAGLAFSPASLDVGHFLPALCALVTWSLYQWLRRNRVKSRS